ncbi:MAG: 50S ribosomal protein L24 [Gammaproteobacteria bacterium]|nr:50S ribosomal protein L24 [Gammaproteobacteria bacterium]
MKRLQQGDRVIVIAGKDKGKIGMIIAIDHTRDRVKVEGIAMATVHEKPNPQLQTAGGRVQKQLSIHVSNVMHYHSKLKKRSRIRVVDDGDSKSRRRVMAIDGSAVE